MSDLIQRILDWWANDEMPAWGIALGETMDRLANADPVFLCAGSLAALVFIITVCCLFVARGDVNKMGNKFVKCPLCGENYFSTDCEHDQESLIAEIGLLKVESGDTTIVNVSVYDYYKLKNDLALANRERDNRAQDAYALQVRCFDAKRERDDALAALEQAERDRLMAIDMRDTAWRCYRNAQAERDEARNLARRFYREYLSRRFVDNPWL